MKNLHLLLGILLIFSVTATIIPVEVNRPLPAYQNRLNNFTLLNYFYAGINLGTTTDTTAGNMRYVNNQFQGYNGTDWLLLGATNGTADTTCDDSVCNLSNSLGYLFTNLDFTGTTGFDDFVDNDTTYSDLSEFNNDVGYFNDIDNFTGSKTNGKICTYDSGNDLLNCTYTDQTGGGGDGGLGSIMYLNIENSFSNIVRWNITQESSDTYTFVVKAGRHWIISGGEV